MEHGALCRWILDQVLSLMESGVRALVRWSSKYFTLSCRVSRIQMFNRKCVQICRGLETARRQQMFSSVSRVYYLILATLVEVWRAAYVPRIFGG